MTWIARSCAPVWCFALALSHPVRAQGPEPIECVYQGVSSAEVHASLRAANATSTASDAAARQKVFAMVGNCSARYNWTASQRTAAVNYTAGRVSYESSVQALTARGIPLAVADQIQSDLGDNWFAKLTTATEADEVAIGDIVVRRLSAINYKFPDDEKEFEQIGEDLGALFVARHMRDEAVVAFKVR